MDKGRATRQRVIAEAAGVFNRRGFAGTTMADLMDATGLQKGGIYRHFAGKEQLALEAFDHAARVATQLRFDDLDPHVNPVEKLKQFVSSFARQRSPIPGGCPVWNTAIDCDDGNATLRERAKMALQSWLDQLTDIAREGQRRGEIAIDVDPARLAVLLLCCLEGALTAARLLGEESPLLMAESHLHAVLDASVARPRISKRSRPE